MSSPKADLWQMSGQKVEFVQQLLRWITPQGVKGREATTWTPSAAVSNGTANCCIPPSLNTDYCPAVSSKVEMQDLQDHDPEGELASLMCRKLTEDNTVPRASLLHRPVMMLARSALRPYDLLTSSTLFGRITRGHWTERLPCFNLYSTS